MYEIFVMLVYYETSFHLFQQHNQHFLTNVFSELLILSVGCWLSLHEPSFHIFLKNHSLHFIILSEDLCETMSTKLNFCLIILLFVICQMSHFTLILFLFIAFCSWFTNSNCFLILYSIFFLFLLLVMFLFPPNLNLCYRNIGTLLSHLKLDTMTKLFS